MAIVMIEIEINPGGVPHCAGAVAIEGDDKVEWFCDDSDVTDWKVEFSKNGSPFTSDPSPSDPRRPVNPGASEGKPRRRFSYKVCATTTAHGPKCVDPPLDIVPQN